MGFGLPAAIGAKVTAPNNVQYDVDGARDGFSVQNNEFQGMERLDALIIWSLILANPGV
jgi:thiamine pyrophosphate-dependent acetolactate synthase large subunit-like protein